MTTRRSAYSLLVLLPSLVTIGCSTSKDDLPRVPVAGTVDMDGRPLPEAVIQFYPIGEKTATSVGANAQIVNGKFSIAREDGLVPGSYKVSISHQELKDVESNAQKKGTPSRSKVLGPERIPAKYNTQSTLKADIKAGGSKDLRFELQSK
jgi:hypothetical protein